MAITILIIVLVVTAIAVFTKVVHSISKNGVKVAFKKNIISIIVVCIVSVMMIGYVVIGSNNIERKAWDYLKSKGYQTSKIQSLEVTHSFLNLILSYDEWQIKVVYIDEPTSVYSYRLVDDKIVDGGVSGTTDKEDLKH
ncbi:MAG: DUF3139 domain-containing protein [Oscillospiraceae bacterium]